MKKISDFRWAVSFQSAGDRNLPLSDESSNSATGRSGRRLRDRGSPYVSTHRRIDEAERSRGPVQRNCIYCAAGTRSQHLSSNASRRLVTSSHTQPPAEREQAPDRPAAQRKPKVKPRLKRAISVACTTSCWDGCEACESCWTTASDCNFNFCTTKRISTTLKTPTTAQTDPIGRRYRWPLRMRSTICSSVGRARMSDLKFFYCPANVRRDTHGHHVEISSSPNNSPLAAVVAASVTWMPKLLVGVVCLYVGGRTTRTMYVPADRPVKV